MVNSTILYLLGWAISCLTVLMFATTIGAVGLGEWTEAGVFLFSSCITGFIAGALIIGFHGRAERLSRHHVAVLVLVVWGVLPLVGALPLYALSGFTELVPAIFEATSGLTTTGASIISSPSEAASSALLWGSALQWFGGALTLLTAVLVLSPFGILSTPMNITIPGYERDDLPKSVIATGRHILPTYVLLTLICMILLWLGGLPTFDALCLALAAISTGGFTPVDGNIASYDSLFSELILMVFMLIGATSILAHRAVLLRVPGTHYDNQESWFLGIVVIAAGVSLAAILAFTSDGSTGETLRVGFFRAISLITTTGFDNAPAGVYAGVPFAIVVALCSIGGASFSTAGGLKVFRIFSMVTQAHRELKRLVHPRGITKARSAGKPIDVQIMKTIWSVFFIYLFAMGVVSILLGAEGIPVDEAVIAAISSLTNTGPALQMTALEGITNAASLYEEMAAVPLLVLSCAMILGRIEFVILLSVGLSLITRR